MDRVPSVATRRGLLLVLGAACALGAAGCGGTGPLTPHDLGPSNAEIVTVNERDFAITASPSSVRSGAVVLQDVNRGPESHELIVVRETDAGLPLRPDGLTLSEEDLAHAIVASLEPGPPGSVRDLRLKLSPGRYVLLCNMEGHYMGGMHAELVVRR